MWNPGVQLFACIKMSESIWIGRMKRAHEAVPTNLSIATALLSVCVQMSGLFAQEG
jgi:hypothetical protein